jgi:hypothetical protein
MMALVSPFAMAILGAAIALALTHGREAGPEDRAVPVRAGPVSVSENDGSVHVTLCVAEGEATKKLVVHGADGIELATFLASRYGSYTLESPASGAVRFVVYRDKSGFVDLGVRSGRAGFVFQARTDGSADILFKDAARIPVYGVRLTPEGDILPHKDAPVR